MATLEDNLGDGLILRAVRDAGDIERYVALSRRVVNEREGALVERVLRHRPNQTLDDFLLVEDTRAGEIVSTTNLMPWRLRFEDVELHAAMLEMVVTHPDYRRRGLVRAQISRFHQAVAARSFDFSIIQGIPYYYRQFGYAYALDHQPRDILPAHRIPDEPVCCRSRPARPDDAPLLAGLYAAGLAGAQMCVMRSADDWRYLLRAADWTVEVVEDAHGRPAGYMRVYPRGAADKVRDGLDVPEAVAVDDGTARGMLAMLKRHTGPTGEIHLPGNEASRLVCAARALGSAPQTPYQWLVRIPDMPRFLRRIAPVLDRRLAGSECAGFTGALTINLFRDAFALRFDAGRLTGASPAGFVDASLGADGGDVCIPPDAFARLVLGYRTLEDLRDAWPDLSVKPERCRLVDILFPRLTSLVWMPY